MIIGNMAETGLKRNGDQSLHAGVVGMLVTSFLSQKTQYIFFRVDFYCDVERFHVIMFLYALEVWGTTQQVCEFRD